jgi:hypothetical protein
METMEIIIPDAGEALVESKGILSDAETLVVTDDDTFYDAQTFLKALKGHATFVHSLYGDEIKQAHGLHKSLKNKENALMEYVKKAERIIKKKMVEYQQKKNAEAREREARIAKEAWDKVQAAHPQADATEVAERAAEVIEAEVSVVVDEPMAKGVAMVETWGFKIVDEEAIPREYLMPNIPRIRQIVRAMKGKTNIPGVKAEVEMGVRASA